jgi:hypothetical protein
VRFSSIDQDPDFLLFPRACFTELGYGVSEHS